jgi:hypothetical protein
MSTHGQTKRRSKLRQIQETGRSASQQDVMSTLVLKSPSGGASSKETEALLPVSIHATSATHHAGALPHAGQFRKLSPTTGLSVLSTAGTDHHRSVSQGIVGAFADHQHHHHHHYDSSSSSSDSRYHGTGIMAHKDTV